LQGYIEPLLAMASGSNMSFLLKLKLSLDSAIMLNGIGNLKVCLSDCVAGT